MQGEKALVLPWMNSPSAQIPYRLPTAACSSSLSGSLFYFWFICKPAFFSYVMICFSFLLRTCSPAPNLCFGGAVMQKRRVSCRQPLSFIWKQKAKEYFTLPCYDSEWSNSKGRMTKQIFWPEGELSSPAVTNCSSDSRAAIELRGRMHLSPEKLRRSNA